MSLLLRSDPVAPPPLAPELSVRGFYRVLGWLFFEHHAAWHDSLKLHAHLACPTVRRWQEGGYVRDHARSGHTGPPQPASVTLEYHVPHDVPRWLRCRYCWGPLYDQASPTRWHPQHRDPLWPFEPDGGWRCSVPQSRWASLQFKAANALWRQHHGGIYEREVLVLSSHGARARAVA